jgi:hypothetical protein
MQFNSFKKIDKYNMPPPLQNCYHFRTLIPPLHVYIYNLSIQDNERNVQPPLENKNKFHRTARRTVI